MADEPGTGDKLSFRELAKLSQEKARVLRLEMAALRETPVKMLGPEAHEDALEAGKELWKEGMKLLGKDPYCQIETPNHKRWNIYGREHASKRDSAPENVEFDVFGPMNEHIEEVNGEKIKYTNHQDYAVTPTGVILIERNWATLVRRDGLEGEDRTPKGLRFEITEIGRDEINGVLSMLQERVAHYPNQG